MTKIPRICREVHWQQWPTANESAGIMRRLAADGRAAHLVFEVRANKNGTRYLLSGLAPAVLDAGRVLDSVRPGTRLGTADLPREPVVTARRLRASTRHRAVAADDPELTARLILGALQHVQGGEELVLQLVLGPRRLPMAVPTKSPSSTVVPAWAVALHGDDGQLDGERRLALRDKVSRHGFAATVRLGVIAATPDRRMHLIRGLLAAIRTIETAGLRLSERPDRPAALNAGRSPLIAWPLRLNHVEAAAFTGWPLGDRDYPGLAPLHPRTLAPASRSTEGRIVATSTAEANLPLRQTATDALVHTTVLGPSGTGKSTLLGHLIEQDVAAGRAVVVLEPKGDLVDEVLAHIPEERQDDVVVLDPSDTNPVGFNPFGAVGRGPGQTPELVADRILTIFKSLYARAWGPRMEDVLSASLLTLAKSTSQPTLVMLPLLLQNRGFRRSLLSGLKDPLALEPFWAWYDSLSPEQQTVVIAPIMSRLRPWLLNGQLRAVLGQRDPLFNLQDVFTKKRILLVPLRGGVIGQEASRLLGSLVVAQLWQGLQGRAGLPAKARHPVMITIDEAPSYMHMADDLGEALAQARGLGGSFTLAAQFLQQYPTAMRGALLSNTRSRILFQLRHEDAVTMSRGHHELEPEDLTALPQYEIYASLFSAGQVQPYASGRTLPPATPISNPELIRARSRARYGRALSDIEVGFAELISGSESARDDAPLGRKRRQQS